MFLTTSNGNLFYITYETVDPSRERDNKVKHIEN